MLLDNINLIEGSINYNLVFTSVTATQRAALANLEAGEVVYQTDGESGLYLYDGSAWLAVGKTSVVEGATLAALPGVGKVGVIYIDKSTYKSYYWNGVDAYVSLTKTDIDAILGGVSAPGNTLKKLYDLIMANANEVTVATIAARDAYNVTQLPLNIFVQDDGDGHWALYKSLSTGIGATFVKLSDPDLLNAAIGFSINTSALLGGSTPSDTLVPSQKAVKAYIDSTVDPDMLPISIKRRATGTVANIHAKVKVV